METFKTTPLSSWKYSIKNFRKIGWKKQTIFNSTSKTSKKNSFFNLNLIRKKKSYLNSSTETGFNAQFILIDSNTPITFYLDKTISLIKQRLQTSFDLEIKKSAFLVLKYCLNSYLKSKPQPGQNLTIRLLLKFSRITFF